MGPVAGKQQELLFQVVTDAGRKGPTRKPAGPGLRQQARPAQHSLLVSIPMPRKSLSSFTQVTNSILVYFDLFT